MENNQVEFVTPEYEFILFDAGFSKVEGEFIFWITLCDIGIGDDQGYALFKIQKAFGEWSFDLGFMNIW